MAEPTLTEVFGSGASVDGSSLVIPASFFAAQGLTISNATHAESLVIAMVLAWQNTLTETARAPDLVNRNVTTTYAGQDTISQAGSQYRRDVWSIVGYKTTTLITVNPGDY
jgi:hypothetical protein